MSLPQIVVPLSSGQAGSEFRVNTYTPASQSAPAVTALSGGGWIVVWMSSGQDGSDHGVYAQRYTAAGAPDGAEFRINTTTTSNQWFPSVTALNDGGWVVAWMSNLQDGSAYGVYAQRYASNGSTVGAEFKVNTYTDSDQSNPSLVGLADGGWVVVWDSWNQDGSRLGVYGQRYDVSGAASGAEFRINTFTNQDQWYPVVDALPDGGWVVSWMSLTQDGSGYGVFGRRFDSGGIPGAEFQINTFVTSTQWYPSIATLSDGGWVVTWMSLTQDGSGYGIYAQRYDSGGVATGAEFQVNTSAAFDQIFPTIASLPDGGWVVTWTSFGQEASGNGIYGRRYAADGSAIGAEFHINTFTSSDQRFTSVAAQSDGTWLAVWESLTQDGSDSGVYGQRLVSFAVAQAGDIVEDNTLYANGNAVTDPNGVGTISWQWQRSTDNGANWVNIAGATGASFAPGDNDVSFLIRVKGTYLDGLNVSKTVFSSGSTPVINVNDMPVGFMAGISGRAEAGSLLTAGASVTSDADGLPGPLTFSYQWRSSVDGNVWVNIGGATNPTYTPGAGDVGKFIQVRASYTDGWGTVESVTSAATPAIFAAGTSFSLSVNVYTVKGDLFTPNLNMIAYDESGELFLRPKSLGATEVSYDVVAKPAAVSGSVAFNIDGDSALSGFGLGNPLAGWTVLQNNPDAASVEVSATGALNGSNHLQANSVVTLASYSQMGESGLGTALSGASIGGRDVADQTLEEVDLQSVSNGVFNETFANGGSGLLNGHLNYVNATRAVSAQDALEALRLAVGLQTTKGTADAFDFIAADFNRDGRVSAQDALEILRYAVGLTTAQNAGWKFVDPNGDLSAITRSNVVYDSGARWSQAGEDTEITLIGVLVGDVNDSFVPA